MKHLYSLSLLLLALLLPATALAHDFEVDGIYYNINGNEASVTYLGEDYVTDPERYIGSVNIPATVTYDGTTYSVTSIDFCAFFYCYGLTNVTIPNTITSIGACAFSACTSLTGITIPNSVTSIGNEAFLGCRSLTSIEIPNSVTSIGNAAFSYCYGLTSIVVASGNPNYDSRNNCNAIIETASNTLITGCKNTVIPNSVISIGNSAFQDCTGLTSITIPNSIKSIGTYGFSGCSDLAKVYCLAFVPPTTDNFAFFGSNGATLYVPESSIEAYKVSDGWKDFYNIFAIPMDFEEEGVRYHSTDGITASVVGYVEDEDHDRWGLVIPETVTHNDFTFTITEVADGSFDGCYYLACVVIGDAVESIGESAFQGCTGLTSVTIGSGVTAIGAKAFNYCNALETVKCLGTVPPVMASSDCFSTAAYNRATLLVPRQFVEVYQAADYWYKFAHIEGWGSAGRGDIDGDGEVSIRDVTRMIDAILTGEHEGVYFESADLNLNGRLDIGDVTTIIDMLLNGN